MSDLSVYTPDVGPIHDLPSTRSIMNTDTWLYSVQDSDPLCRI